MAITQTPEWLSAYKTNSGALQIPGNAVLSLDQSVVAWYDAKADSTTILTLRSYTPVANGTGNVNTGWRTLTGVDLAGYLAKYSDVYQAYGGASNPDILSAAAADYGSIGPSYGRNLAPSDFNWRDYLAVNGDVRAAVGVSAVGALNHYMSSGKAEVAAGKRVIGGFDWISYEAANLDVAKSVGFGAISGSAARTTKRNVLDHYLNNGVNEKNRSLTFDAAGYLNANPDLKAYFGNDLPEATKHYLSSGLTEMANGKRAAFPPKLDMSLIASLKTKTPAPADLIVTDPNAQLMGAGAALILATATPPELGLQVGAASDPTINLTGGAGVANPVTLAGTSGSLINPNSSVNAALNTILGLASS